MQEDRISNIGKFYLYRHIRLDKNEPFYIGIGTKPKGATLSEYSRSKMTCNRKSMWKNIVNNTDYEIEVLLESDNYEFIKEKEKEFIALYGRRDLGTGTLVNHTDGGEGTKGWIPSEETRDKIRKKHSGNRVGAKNHNAKKVINTITKEIFSYAKEVSDKEGFNYSTFRNYLNGGLWNKTEYMYLKDYEQGLKINDYTKSPPPFERQFKYINTITGEKYKTVKEVSEVCNYSECYTYNMLHGLRKNKTNIIPI